MYKNLFGYLALLLLLPSCGGVTPHIVAVCEEDNAGNSIVKWETMPAIEGEVKVFASHSPNRIPEDKPVATADISHLTVTIPNADPTRRNYYTLLFNGKFRVSVASRNIRIPGIQNFRDIGGYPSNRVHKEVRWGMVYRSARIDSLNETAREELKNLGIRSVVDLRATEETGAPIPLPEGIRRHSIGIPVIDLKSVLNDLEKEKITNDTIYRMVERANRLLISDYTPAYRQLFRLLLDKENYPILIQCSTGKGRTGVAIALLLYALGVSEELIMYDYCLSNTYFNIPAASGYVYDMPAAAQEAVTTMLSARENYLDAAKDEAERRYSDLDIYLQKGIGLDKNEIKQLQNILLH